MIDLFILNVYSDDNQSAINFLRDHETNLSNVLVMAGDFNIRDHDWDPLFPHHSSHADDLITIADSQLRALHSHQPRAHSLHRQ